MDGQAALGYDETLCEGHAKAHRAEEETPSSTWLNKNTRETATFATIEARDPMNKTTPKSRHKNPPGNPITQIAHPKYSPGACKTCRNHFLPGSPSSAKNLRSVMASR